MEKGRNKETSEVAFVFAWVSERRRLHYRDSTGNGELRGGGVLKIVLRTWGGGVEERLTKMNSKILNYNTIII